MGNSKTFAWDGENLTNLFEKSVEELRTLYPGRSDETFSRARRQHRAKYQGKTGTPVASSSLIEEDTRQKLHKLLDKTIDETNINPEAIGRFRVNAGTHEGYIKNNDGEIEYTKALTKANITFIAEPEKFKAKWEPVQQASSVIKAIPHTKPNKDDKKQKTCVVIPDPQIGFSRLADGSLYAYHDDNAISIALQVIADLQPDKVVCLGDYLDLPMFGRFEQSENYAHTAQLAINYGHDLLASIRASVPNAEIAVIEGNHDRRIQNSITASNMSAFSLRRADDLQGWPVFSVPYLLNFDSLNIKYVEGYPAGKYWINDRLQAIHGHIVGPPGQTAAKVVKAETVSTIFGHIHRIEMAFDTQNVFEGGRSNLAFSPGCLCRIDGGVPSAKGSTDLMGRPIKSYENWQQGMAIVDYEDGDAPFSLHPIYINTLQGYKTTVNGKVYLPNPDLIQKRA